MYLEAGGVQDARQIAMIYQDAFPKSIQLFFAKKDPAKLLDLLELSFKLIFYWGGQALVAKTESKEICGYCLYLSTKEAKNNRDYKKLLFTAPKIIGKIRLSELTRLLQNKLLMIASTQQNDQKATPQAHIVSIAVSPTHQGQGLGKLLLSNSLTHLDDQIVALNVRPNNLSARHIYKTAGFEAYGKTKDLSGDWLMMRRSPI